MLPMPEINAENMKDMMTAEQWELVAPCFAKSKGAIRLRASRPTKAKGASQYIWRMIAFVISTNPQHHCIPIGADFYINDTDYAHRDDKYIPRAETEHDRETVAKWDAKTWERMHKGTQRRKYMSEELDPIVDLITESIPKSQWRGAHRWHKAFYG